MNANPERIIELFSQAIGVVLSTSQAIRATRAEREQIRLRETAQSEAAKSSAMF